mgnify:CR=1 FL=1|tara:strand:- start:3055 stop:3327 length:273 start_codon:yes stop_codon:yes gene_type:complete
MPTLEDLRTKDWISHQNAPFVTELGDYATGLRKAADRGVVGSATARELAARIDDLFDGWVGEARWWLRDHRPEINCLLQSHTPAELIGEA